MTAMNRIRWLPACLLLWIPMHEAFVPTTAMTPHHHCIGHQSDVSSRKSSSLSAVGNLDESFLLEEFKTYKGELIDPYKVLKVSPQCDRSQVKKSYRDLSRRYHPDATRHRDILPGSCNNMAEVRDHWERIKLAYEILSDAATRRRYDRHLALADPGAALKRAAVNAAVSGVTHVGKGIFDAGAFAFQKVTGKLVEEAKKNVR